MPSPGSISEIQMQHVERSAEFIPQLYGLDQKKCVNAWTTCRLPNNHLDSGGRFLPRRAASLRRNSLIVSSCAHTLRRSSSARLDAQLRRERYILCIVRALLMRRRKRRLD